MATLGQNGELFFGAGSAFALYDNSTSGNINLGKSHTIFFKGVKTYNNTQTQTLIGSGTTNFISLSSAGLFYRAGNISVTIQVGFQTNVSYDILIVRNGLSVSVTVNGVPMTTGTLSANNDFVFRYLGTYTATSPLFRGELKQLKIY